MYGACLISMHPPFVSEYTTYEVVFIFPVWARLSPPFFVKCVLEQALKPVVCMSRRQL